MFALKYEINHGLFVCSVLFLLFVYSSAVNKISCLNIYVCVHNNKTISTILV